MAAQNFVALGLDVSGFDATKEQTLNRFIALFDKLSLYDGKTINPVFGSGLVQFNESVAASGKLLDELNVKLAELNKNTNTTSSSNSKATKETKKLTEEQAKLKIELAETNKRILDNAKAQNESVQARVREKKAIADESKAKADAAKQDRKDKATEAENNRNLSKSKADAARQDKKDKTDQIANERLLARAKRERDAAARETIRTERDESRATEKLTSDYELLKLAQKDQAIAYSNLFIAKGGKAGHAQNDPAVKESFLTLQNTSTQINDIEKGLGKATQGAGQFGNSLTKGLSSLRTLAYILPGIGIAGIFNLAFEAIGKAVESLGLFNEKELDTLKFNELVNKSLAEQVGAYEDLVKMLKAYNEQFSYNLVNNKAASTLSQNRDQEDLNSAKGLRDNILLTDKLTNSSQRLSEAIRGISPKNDDVPFSEKLAILKNQAEQQLNTIRRANAEIKRNDELISATDTKSNTFLGIPNKVKDGDQTFRVETVNARIAASKAEKELALANYDVLTAKLKEYYAALKQNDSDRFIREKFIDDETRKRVIANTKNDISVNQDKNDKILSADISSEQKKTAALRRLRQDQIEIANLDLYNVVGNKSLGIPANVSATDDDIRIAKRKHNDDLLKINADFNQKQIHQDEEYRQQRLKSQSEIDQAIIGQDAERDLKIKNNEENSLTDRIEALNRYFIARQKLQDIQLKTELDQDKYKTGDETADKLIEEQYTKAQEQKANIQADAEKSVYDIVYQSTQKQLKLIIDENKITIEKNKERYGQEVRDLTDSFRNKKISYSKYKRELKEIDDKFQSEALDKTIEQDKEAVEKIRDNLKKNALLLEAASKNVSSTQQSLINEKQSGGGATLKGQADFDEATGLYNGYLKAVQSGEVALSNAVEKQKDDEFKRNNIRLNEDLKLRRQYYQAAKQIEESLYHAVKEFGDRGYQERLEKLDLAKAAIEEQYSLEKDAIADSSLDAKNKAALDIQLSAQKRQQAENTAREERRIKHDQAVFDRDIAIAHILLSTAEAVASLIAVPILAVAAGIAGGAELAIASSVHIPSYAGGVKNKAVGGTSRFGEAGWEVVKEPYRSPYLVTKETIGWLPKGTDVIPLKDNPELGGSVAKDESWKQTMWLAKQIKKAMPDGKVVNNITINLGFAEYKRSIIGR